MSYKSAFERLMRYEGGESNHPADRGGHTMFGIPQGTFDEFMKRMFGRTLPVTCITREFAEMFFFHEYWLRYRCAKLPPNIDEYYFDCCVHHGPHNATKILQRAINLGQLERKHIAVDGVKGPITTARAFDRSNYSLFISLFPVRTEFMYEIVDSDESQDVFLGGWINRARRVHDEIYDKYFWDCG